MGSAVSRGLSAPVVSFSSWEVKMVVAKANQDWAEMLSGWAIPDELVAGAPASPYFFDPLVFITAADEALARGEDTSSDVVARDALPAGGTVLDVGCGAGAASLRLRPGRLVGVDPSVSPPTAATSSPGRGTPQRRRCRRARRLVPASHQSRTYLRPVQPPQSSRPGPLSALSYRVRTPSTASKTATSHGTSTDVHRPTSTKPTDDANASPDSSSNSAATVSSPRSPDPVSTE